MLIGKKYCCNDKFFDSYLLQRKLNICSIFDNICKNMFFNATVVNKSGGELLEMRLLDSHLLDTFGNKSIARHKFYQLLESS
jgi:hypothetical protein